MTARRPLVLAPGGHPEELPAGDTILGAPAGSADYQPGDLAFSADPTRYSLPDWLPCDGALLDNATAPASLQNYMVQAAGTDYSADGGVEPMTAAPTGVYDMLGDYALMQMSASPFAIPLKKNVTGYSYLRESFASNPTAALKCAALGMGNGVVNMLGFTTAAGGAFHARALSSSWSISNVASLFTGKTVAGVVFGADNRFYLLSSTAPYLHSIDGQVASSELVDIGGASASGTGLAISPNKKYMVSWHSVAPFLNVFEFDGAKYVNIGSPPTGAAAYLRVEVSDTGVIVGKPTSSSVYHICRVLPTGAVSGMTLNTVNAATSWGITPDGRNLITWVSNAANVYPIANNTVGVASALAMYSSASYGTLAGRFGFTSGRLIVSSSLVATGYAMAGSVTPSGWIAPSIKYGFMKT